MGQYYYPVSLDCREYLLAHAFDNGLKLMEHSYVGNNFMAAIENLLQPGEAWYKTRLVWAGDYADEGKFLENLGDIDYEHNGETYSHNLYTYASDHYVEVAPEATNQVRNEQFRYLINHSKKQYVDINQLQSDSSGLIIHPLALLTCDGNGRGGGDYRSSASYTLLMEQREALERSMNIEADTLDYHFVQNEINDLQHQIEAVDVHVGLWSGDVISVDDGIPISFTQIHPFYSEGRG